MHFWINFTYKYAAFFFVSLSGHLYLEWYFYFEKCEIRTLFLFGVNRNLTVKLRTNQKILRRVKVSFLKQRKVLLYANIYLKYCFILKECHKLWARVQWTTCRDARQDAAVWVLRSGTRRTSRHLEAFLWRMSIALEVDVGLVFCSDFWPPGVKAGSLEQFLSADVKRLKMILKKMILWVQTERIFLLFFKSENGDKSRFRRNSLIQKRKRAQLWFATSVAMATTWFFFTVPGFIVFYWFY